MTVTIMVMMTRMLIVTGDAQGSRKVLRPEFGCMVSSLYKGRNWNVGEFKLVKLECWSHLNRKDVINRLWYFIVDN